MRERKEIKPGIGLTTCDPWIMLNTGPWMKDPLSHAKLTMIAPWDVDNDIFEKIRNFRK